MEDEYYARAIDKIRKHAEAKKVRLESITSSETLKFRKEVVILSDRRIRFTLPKDIQAKIIAGQKVIVEGKILLT